MEVEFYDDPKLGAKAKVVLKSIGFPAESYDAMFDPWGRPWHPDVTTQHIANKMVAEYTYVSEEVIDKLNNECPDYLVMLARLMIVEISNNDIRRSDYKRITTDLVQYIIAMSEPNEFDDDNDDDDDEEE